MTFPMPVMAAQHGDVVEGETYPPLGSHRYWRVEFTDNDTGITGSGNTSFVLSEMQALASYGGGNLMRAGNTTTNVTGNTTASQPFSNIFDARYGQSGSTFYTWAPYYWPTDWPQVDIDLGAGNEQPINIVRIGSSSAYSEAFVREIKVYFSDDGVNYTLGWTARLDDTFQTYQIYDFVYAGFSEPTYAGSPHPEFRYYRMLYFDYIHSLFGIACVEMEFRTVSGGADIASGGTASASKTNSGSAAQAFDGNAATFHYMAFTSGRISNEWITYDLGAGNAAKVGEATFRCRQDTGSNEHYQSVNRHAIQGSNDGVTWDTLWCDAFGEPASELVMISTDPLYIE